MNEQSSLTESKKTNKISLKRILTALSFSILLITSLLFGYFYFTDTDSIIRIVTEKSQTQENENDDDDESEVVCDFEEIKESVAEEKDSSRVHLAYRFILDPDPSPLSPYAACKETLKSTIISILEKQKNGEYDNELLESIAFMVEDGYIEYLIDDDFVINGLFDSTLWKVNIVDESLDILWEVKNNDTISVFGLTIIQESNTAKMFFGTGYDGMGGATEEEQEAYDKMVRSSCELNELGIWMYDTSTNATTKIADSEECK